MAPPSDVEDAPPDDGTDARENVRSAAPATAEPDDVNEDGDVASIETAAARRALFSAVEGGAEGKEEILSCAPMARLFFSKDKDDSIGGEAKTANKRQKTLLASVRSHKFHKGFARRLFSGIIAILTRTVENEEYVPASAFEDDSDEEGSRRRGCNNENPTEKSMDIEPDEKSTESLQFMRACALTTGAYIGGLVDRRSKDDSDSKEYNVIDEAFTVAELLHSTLFSLQSCGVLGLQVQMIIASLCETWWHKRFVDRELLVTQLVPLLVIKTLDGSAQKSHIKRLFMMKASFDLLDFEDGSIAYLRSLLLRTVSSPLYLRNVEGRRLITHLFLLDKALVSDLHKAIRVQIPEAKKSILEAYGDIYFRSWRDSSEIPEVRATIEDDALQDLMYALLHVSNRTMAKSIKTVLGPLHESKKSPQVEKLLHRMYSPILWRALSAANPLVRVNAAAVLGDTFPLKDPEEGEQHAEACVRKAVSCLESLLRDSHYQVRVAGAAAAARILGAFWEAVPSDDIRSILNILITKHTSDASSPAVRAEAVSAVTLLLENPHSHGVLRPLLPSVGNLIHDKVEKVRLATVKMLIRVKKIRGIKYFHVVPVNHLLARLEAEGEGSSSCTGPVASALTSLVLNSYFPRGDGVTSSDQVKRTLNFLINNPEAASVFYSNISSHLSVSAVAKLVAMLLRCLTVSIKAERKLSRENERSDRKRRRSQNESDSSRRLNSSQDGVLNASNTVLMASIAETICCLWESIGSALLRADNYASREYLRKAFSGSVLTDIVVHFQKKGETLRTSVVGDETVLECNRICAAILRCAGKLQQEAVTGLSAHIVEQFAGLKKKTPEERMASNFSCHVALLCIWGMHDDVAASLANSIKSRFTEEDNDERCDQGEKNGREERKRSNKRKQGTDASQKSRDSLLIPRIPTDCALRILGSILGGADPSSTAAREAILASESACSVIETSLECATPFAEKILNRSLVQEMNIKESTVGLVLAACESYGRLALHKEARKGGLVQFNQQAKTLLSWISDRVVPSIITKRPSGEFSPLGELNLSRISVDSNGGMSPSEPLSPAPSAPPRRKCNRNKTPTKFDTSFESINDSMSLPFVYEGSNTLYVEVAAVSLVKSALLLFAEWVAVSGTGIREISIQTTKWTQILHYRSERLNVREELLVSFLRLATNLVKINGNCAILKATILACAGAEEGSQDDLCLKRTISSLFSLRSIDRQSVVSAILDAVEKFLEDESFSERETFDCPLSVHDCLPTENVGVAAALAAVLGSGSGSVGMAREIAGRLEDCNTERCRGKQIFYVLFLCLLCEKPPTKGAGADIKAIIRSTGEPGVRPELEDLIRSTVEKAR